MELSYSHEAYVFFGTLLGGVLIGMVFDFYRVLRNHTVGGVVIIGAQDVLFWMLLSLIAFGAIFITNSGQVRWYEILGIVLGFVIYGLTLSRYFVKLLDFIAKWIQKTVRFLIRIFAVPIRFLLKLVKKPLGIVLKWGKFVSNRIKSVKNKQKLKVRQIKHIFKKI